MLDLGSAAGKGWLERRNVEPGRVAVIRYGPLTGKVVTIVDMISLAKCLVDGPTTGVARQQIPVKWLDLTDVVTPLGRGATEKVLKKSLAASGAMKTWEATKWAKSMAAKAAKKDLNDFGRFKLQAAKSKANKAVKKVMAPKPKKAKK